MLSDAASDGSGMASEGPDLDMGALATRIADVQALPAPEAVRIFDLDAMVPRQRLAFDAPQAFVDQLDQAEADGGKALVMVGRELSALNSHGFLDSFSANDLCGGASPLGLKTIVNQQQLTLNAIRTLDCLFEAIRRICADPKSP